MKCFDCHGRLKVTHSHATARARASRAVCEGCGGVYTLATTVLRGDKRGEGAKAVAAKLRNGTAHIRLEDGGGDPVEDDETAV